MARKTPVFRRGGRPRKPDLDKRASPISVRVRPDERAAIEARAASSNYGFADPMDVLGILVHQLTHAALPPEAKHGKPFRDAALRLGLEGPMRNAMPGPALRERLNELAAALGPLPHGRLDFHQVNLAGMAVADRPKKQTTRMLKAECLASACGYTVRVAARWLSDLGAPHCPKHGAMTTPPLPPLGEDDDSNLTPTAQAAE
jgi:hypothetical protein